MKCNICDADLPEPKYNPQVKGRFDPCDKCMAVIEDTLNGFIDNPSADEEDFGFDPTYDELYPQQYDPFDTES